MMPVYQDALLFLGAAVVLAFALVVVVVRGVIRRRALSRRLSHVASRMADTDVPPRPLESVLARLEQAADDALFGASRATTSVDRLRFALEELATGLVVCDEHGEVLFRNPAAGTHLGWSAARTNGGGSRAGSHRPDEPAVAEAFASIVTDALAGRRATRLIEAVGPPRRSLRIRGIPLDDGTRNVGAAVVIDDLSVERDVSGARRDLLADLGHQLAEPMVSLALLADGVVTEGDAALRQRMAERLSIEASRTRRHLDDLLELARLAAEEGRPRERVPVDNALRKALEQGQAAAQRRAVTFKVSALPPCCDVAGDRRQVDLAVIRLIDHVVSGSRAGARLEIAVRAEDEWLDIEVLAPGGAIAHRRGLALELVEQAARNLGGAVSAESGDSDNVLWRLRLPASPVQSARVDTASNSDAKHTQVSNAGVSRVE